MHQPNERSDSELVEGYPRNWGEAERVQRLLVVSVQNAMVSGSHEEQQQYIGMAKKLLRLMPFVLEQKRLEIRKRELEVVPLVISRDKLSLTQDDVERFISGEITTTLTPRY